MQANAPPLIAFGENASFIIKVMVSGRWCIFNKHTIKALVTYKEHITGVTLEVNLPIALIPPIIVNHVIIATIVPSIQPLSANILELPPVTSVIWAVIALI